MGRLSGKELIVPDWWRELVSKGIRFEHDLTYLWDGNVDIEMSEVSSVL